MAKLNRNLFDVKDSITISNHNGWAVRFSKVPSSYVFRLFRDGQHDDEEYFFAAIEQPGIHNEALKRFLRSTIIDTQSFTFRKMTPSSIIVELQIVIDKNPNDPDPLSPLKFTFIKDKVIITTFYISKEWFY